MPFIGNSEDNPKKNINKNRIVYGFYVYFATAIIT
jgi:hypothetical protein